MVLYLHVCFERISIVDWQRSVTRNGAIVESAMDNHRASTSPRAWAEILGSTANHDLRSAMFLLNAFCFYASFIIHWLQSDFHWKHSDQDIFPLSVFRFLFTRHFCRQWIRAEFGPSIVLFASLGDNINRYALCREYFRAYIRSKPNSVCFSTPASRMVQAREQSGREERQCKREHIRENRWSVQININAPYQRCTSK